MRPETRFEGKHPKIARYKQVPKQKDPCPKQEVKTRGVEKVMHACYLHKELSKLKVRGETACYLRIKVLENRKSTV